jgi:hypothetical protein
MNDTPERISFSEGRQPVATIAAELATATGLPLERILEEIPDLTKEHLAAGAYWESDRYSEGSEIAHYNAGAYEGIAIVQFPNLNVEGTSDNDMTGVMRSHLLNSQTGEIRSFKDFNGAFEWLSQNLGYHSVRNS